MRYHADRIDRCQYEGHTRLVPTTLTAAPPEPPVALLDGCCAPVTGARLDQEASETLARIFKALGDPTRVRLVSLIAAADGREACVCDLTDPIGLSQPTVSHHLKQLVDAGLLTREQRGKWAYYRVVDETLTALSRALAPPPNRPNSA
jgi:ArsR family transcriptional regulator, arsenate/arsenite/antimonite-responsive transcriptional repressor